MRLKHDIAALKEEIKNAPPSTGSTSATVVAQAPQLGGPSMNDQLRSQLIALNVEMKAREARQQQLEQRLAQLQGSVGGLPAVQTQFAALIATTKKCRRITTHCWNNSRKPRWRPHWINVTKRSSSLSPNRHIFPLCHLPEPLMLNMAVVLMGLLAGFLFGLVVEIGDDTMHHSDEVGAYLKLPVMVSLPKCSNLADGTWGAATLKS